MQFKSVQMLPRSKLKVDGVGYIICSKTTLYAVKVADNDNRTWDVYSATEHNKHEAYATRIARCHDVTWEDALLLVRKQLGKV